MSAEHLKPFRWKKGKAEEAGRPRGGRRPITEVEAEAREASRREISEIWIELKDCTLEQLNAMLKDYKTLTAVRAVFIKSLANGIKNGDTSEFHRMYDRMLGKPKIFTEHSLDSDLSKKIKINVGFKSPSDPETNQESEQQTEPTETMPE